MRKRTDKVIVLKDAEMSEEMLIQKGKIRELFNRVSARKISVYDPTLRIRRPKPLKIADLTLDGEALKEQLKTMENDCLGLYKTGDIEAFIIRTASAVPAPITNVEEGSTTYYETPHYACEIVKDGESVDSFWDDNIFELLASLRKDYPLGEKEEKIAEESAKIFAPPKRKLGRPKKVVEEASDGN